MSASRPWRPGELCSRDVVTAGSVDSSREPRLLLVYLSNRTIRNRCCPLRSFESRHVYLPSSRFALNIRSQRKPRSHHGIHPTPQIHRHRPAPQDGRLVARGQSSLRRRDVSLRQTCAQATAKQEHVNPRLLRHLRATPGLSVSYVRLSRAPPGARHKPH